MYDYARKRRTLYSPYNQLIVVNKREGESDVISSVMNTVVLNQTYLERSTVRAPVGRGIWPNQQPETYDRTRRQAVVSECEQDISRAELLRRDSGRTASRQAGGCDPSNQSEVFL